MTTTDTRRPSPRGRHAPSFIPGCAEAFLADRPGAKLARRDGGHCILHAHAAPDAPARPTGGSRRCRAQGDAIGWTPVDVIVGAAR